MPDLALLDQVLDGARHVFDRHSRIDAMLIEQVDVVGPAAASAMLGDLPDMLWPAVKAELAELCAECMNRIWSRSRPGRGTAPGLRRRAPHS